MSSTRQKQTLRINKRSGHSFHLEKEDLIPLSELKVIMEQRAWAVRRLLESPELYRQRFSFQLRREVDLLLNAHAVYQNSRTKRVLHRG